MDRPEIAFAGRSNVGKSSLINVLVNRKKLARTSSTPGRTQAINFFSVGEALYLVDLPGYGYAKVPLAVRRAWRDMVEGYLKGRDTLKAVVLIIDIRRDPGREEHDLIAWFRHHQIPCVLVLTKADKISKNKATSRASAIRRNLEGMVEAQPLVFSAKTGGGKEKIGERINRLTGLEVFPGHRP